MLSFKIITTFYRRMVVVKHALNNLSDAPLEPSTEIRLLAAGDLDAYHRFHPNYSELEYKSRLACGEQCFAVMYEGRMVHVGWGAAHPSSVPYLGCDLVPGESGFYLHGIYTDPHYRHHGFAAQRANYSLKYYESKGFTYSLGLVAFENVAGRSSAISFGFYEIGLIHCLRLGPWQRTWQQAWGDEPLPVLQKSVTGLQ